MCNYSSLPLIPASSTIVLSYASYPTLVPSGLMRVLRDITASFSSVHIYQVLRYAYRGDFVYRIQIETSLAPSRFRDACNTPYEHHHYPYIQCIGCVNHYMRYIKLVLVRNYVFKHIEVRWRIYTSLKLVIMDPAGNGFRLIRTKASPEPTLTHFRSESLFDQ